VNPVGAIEVVARDELDDRLLPRIFRQARSDGSLELLRRIHTMAPKLADAREKWLKS